MGAEWTDARAKIKLQRWGRWDFYLSKASTYMATHSITIKPKHTTSNSALCEAGVVIDQSSFLMLSLPQMSLHSLVVVIEWSIHLQGKGSGLESYSW